MVEMLVVVICFLVGREYFVVYVIQEILQLEREQLIFVMIVEIGFN